MSDRAILTAVTAAALGATAAAITAAHWAIARARRAIRDHQHRRASRTYLRRVSAATPSHAAHHAARILDTRRRATR